MTFSCVGMVKIENRHTLVKKAWRHKMEKWSRGAYAGGLELDVECSY